jgi:hypothetical protein
MVAQSFLVGDRVRARVSTLHFREGMLGTIQAVVQPLTSLYLVRFDELLYVELAAEEALELVEAVQPPYNP